MTQELVNKVRAYVAERRRELETSANAEELARKRLQELGYLDENGEIAEQYWQGIPEGRKPVNCR
ncbi:hypothetical protein SAMN05216327_103513 [Dyadobacter sp. SG02]|uniref:hypothetical protein n=1 Tax=Dyadobacter sp. SG02 TaxID=1855291 RepID=UPI0008C27D6C|nr:hypothetical protein [Dyadobacter sp. SG02]SEI73778.1 hypothetical protein SAMN05216327_103513 [Dyadobacter sp. SG02]